MLTGATLPFAAVAPAAADLPAFAASAVPGPAAQLCIIRSFSLAEASAVAPLGYAGIVPATLWGRRFLGEWPGAATFPGAVVIAGAGLYVWRRETAAGRARR